MECRPSRAQEWLEDHARELDGLDSDGVVALIEATGLDPRVVRYAGGATQELRSDRITVWLTADGGIASIDAG